MKKIFVLCLLCFASVGWGGERALDHEGNLYHVYATTNQGISVLLLDIWAPDGSLTSLPVRGTKIISGALSPQIVFSNLSKRLFIVFTQEDSVSSDIVLVAYTKLDGFSAPLLLSSGSPIRRALNPQLTITTEASVDEQNHKTWLQLLHVLWWEEGFQPGAYYMNLPVTFQFGGLDSATVLRLDDFLFPGVPPVDMSPFSPQIYQYPSMSVPAPGVSRLQILYFSTGLGQLQLLELTYSPDAEIARDRAHFPDIGVMNTFTLPPGFSPTQTVASVVVDSANIGLFSMEPEGPAYTLFCSGWTPPRLLPFVLLPSEVEGLLRSVLSNL